MPIDPVLNQKTVVTPDDAMWLPYGSRVIDPKLGEETKLEFATRQQLDALLKVMKDSGINIDQVQVVDSAPNWNAVGFRRLVYLRDDGPRLYSLTGPITLPDGTETVLNLNVGYFINVRRIGKVGYQPPQIPFGDRVQIWMPNPFMPLPIWAQ